LEDDRGGPEMSGTVDPRRALVLSVGIEKYDYGELWDLPGSAAAALRFATWAIRCGVPPERVTLACSWLDIQPQLPERLWAKVPTFGQLKRVITNISDTEGDLLLIFWCGHGVVNDNEERALFTSDGTLDGKQNLPVDEILRYLRSTKLTGFGRQILLIDTCANFVEEMSFDEELPRVGLPAGKGRRRIAQFAFFAAAPGQTAGVSHTRGEPMFSTIALSWLEEHALTALPPDVDALTPAGHRRLRKAERPGPDACVPESPRLRRQGRHRWRHSGPREAALAGWEPRLSRLGPTACASPR
jgi:hypothetical protein